MFPIITAIKAISNRGNNKISESVFLKNFAAISPINPAKTIFKKNQEMDLHMNLAVTSLQTRSDPIQRLYNSSYFSLMK